MLSCLTGSMPFSLRCHPAIKAVQVSEYSNQTLSRLGRVTGSVQRRGNQYTSAALRASGPAISPSQCWLTLKFGCATVPKDGAAESVRAKRYRYVLGGGGQA